MGGLDNLNSLQVGALQSSNVFMLAVLDQWLHTQAAYKQSNCTH